MSNKNKIVLAVATALANVAFAQTLPPQTSSAAQSPAPTGVAVRQATPSPAMTPSATSASMPVTTAPAGPVARSPAVSSQTVPSAANMAASPAAPAAPAAQLPNVPVNEAAAPSHGPGGTIGTISALSGQLKILQLQEQIADARAKATQSPTTPNATVAAPSGPIPPNLPPLPTASSGSSSDSDKKASDDTPDADPQVLNAFGKGHGEDLTADVVYKNHYYEVSAKEGENAIGDWKVVSITPRVMTLTKVVKAHKAGKKATFAALQTKLIPVTYGVTDDSASGNKDSAKTGNVAPNAPGMGMLPSAGGPSFPAGFPFNNSSTTPSRK